MLTDTKLRSDVEALWDKLWSGGLANPLDAIEQLSFLLFLKRLDEREQDAERAAKLRGKKFTRSQDFRAKRFRASVVNSPSSIRFCSAGCWRIRAGRMVAAIAINCWALPMQPDGWESRLITCTVITRAWHSPGALAANFCFLPMASRSTFPRSSALDTVSGMP
jgi:hypothetical protein